MEVGVAPDDVWVTESAVLGERPAPYVLKASWKSSASDKFESCWRGPKLGSELIRVTGTGDWRWALPLSRASCSDRPRLRREGQGPVDWAVLNWTGEELAVL